MLCPYNGRRGACGPANAAAIEQIRFDEMDAIGNAMAGSVATRNRERGTGNVGGVNRCLSQFFGESDGDAAGAGADVGDLQALAGERLFAADAKFADGEAVEGDFDNVFRFGAGNQDVGRYFKLETPEFLFAGEVLR